MEIRTYKAQEYERVKRWWDLSGEVGPSPDMLPLDSTFFVCEDGRDLLCFTLYLTNCKRVLWMECLIGNPEIRGKIRTDAAKFMISWTKKYAKRQGYASLFCMSHRPRLDAYYIEELGFRKTVEVSCFSQEV